MENVYTKVIKLKENLPDMKPGDTIRVSEKILEKSKKKSQVFEGILISRKHGKGINATFTLRSVIGGVGVEKTYPLHSPLIEKIRVVKRGKARRAKLYYIRKKAEKAIKKKLKSQIVVEKVETSKKTEQKNNTKESSSNQKDRALKNKEPEDKKEVKDKLKKEDK